jgi:hypothetical protein
MQFLCGSRNLRLLRNDLPDSARRVSCPSSYSEPLPATIKPHEKPICKSSVSQFDAIQGGH